MVEEAAEVEIREKCQIKNFKSPWKDFWSTSEKVWHICCLYSFFLFFSAWKWKPVEGLSCRGDRQLSHYCLISWREQPVRLLAIFGFVFFKQTCHYFEQTHHLHVWFGGNLLSAHWYSLFIHFPKYLCLQFKLSSSIYWLSHVQAEDYTFIAGHVSRSMTDWSHFKKSKLHHMHF